MKDFYALRRLRHGLCICGCAIQRGNGKTKYLSAFAQGIVVGARHTGLSVSRTATLPDFSRATVSHVCQEWSTTQRTSSQRQASGRKWLIDERDQGRLI